MSATAISAVVFIFFKILFVSLTSSATEVNLDMLLSISLTFKDA
jgi:hypothetical protein